VGERSDSTRDSAELVDLAQRQTPNSLYLLLLAVNGLGWVWVGPVGVNQWVYQVLRALGGCVGVSPEHWRR
jgi:hypothetical protein